jgi:hypothetical protein
MKLEDKFAKIFDNVNGASFVGIDTLTEVPLLGGKKNEMQGRVTKRTVGNQVMVFQNKSSSSYGDMVQRRLLAEGKDPASFELQPRTWGERIPETPFISHTKDGDTTFYLEVIFLRPGTSTYLLDGKPINKADIVGLKPESAGGEQGGLDNKVIIRSFKLTSIEAVRIDGMEYRL